MTDLTPRTITIPDADGNAVTIAGFDDGDGNFLQGIVYRGADGTPVQVLDDGSLAISVAGGEPTTAVAPQSPNGVGSGAPPGYFQFDMSAAEIGSHFRITPPAHQGIDIYYLLSVPAPDEPRYFTIDYRAGSDPTAFAGALYPATLVDFDGYTVERIGSDGGAWTFTGATDAILAARSSGDGVYQLIEVDPTRQGPFVTWRHGNGLLAGANDVREQAGRLEGDLDRFLEACAISEDPTFDIDSPVWDFGAPVAGSIVVALALADGNPAHPWTWLVNEDGTTFTELVDPAVFNPPGNGYLVIYAKSGDPDDGRWYRYESNDTGLIYRAGSPLHMDDQTGRWAAYSGPTGFIAAG